MIEIKTDNIEELKEVCESLAYKVAQFENPGQYMWTDKQVGDILRCEGLVVNNE